MDNCFVLETKFWTSQPITPENEGGDNTNYPSPPNVELIDDPEVPLDPVHTHPKLTSPEPQFIPIPMCDGEDDDDQPPQGERQRQRSRPRERVHRHVQVPQEPQIQPMVTPESDDRDISSGFSR